MIDPSTIPPPFAFSDFVNDNKGTMTGTFFGGLLPKEIEMKIFKLLHEMYMYDCAKLVLPIMGWVMLPASQYFFDTSRLQRVTYNEFTVTDFQDKTQDYLINQLQDILNTTKKRYVRRHTIMTSNRLEDEGWDLGWEGKGDHEYCKTLMYSRHKYRGALGSINHWNDGDITINKRDKCEYEEPKLVTGVITQMNDQNPFIGQTKIHDWVAQYKWYNMWWSNSNRQRWGGPNIADNHSNSKFLMDINITTPIKKLKQYCKDNNIKGYSKISSKNRNEWITKIYSQE